MSYINGPSAATFVSPAMEMDWEPTPPPRQPSPPEVEMIDAPPLEPHRGSRKRKFRTADISLLTGPKLAVGLSPIVEETRTPVRLELPSPWRLSRALRPITFSSPVAPPSATPPLPLSLSPATPHPPGAFSPLTFPSLPFRLRPTSPRIRPRIYLSQPGQPARLPRGNVRQLAASAVELSGHVIRGGSRVLSLVVAGTQHQRVREARGAAFRQLTSVVQVAGGEVSRAKRLCTSAGESLRGAWLARRARLAEKKTAAAARAQLGATLDAAIVDGELRLRWLANQQLLLEEKEGEARRHRAAVRTSPQHEYRLHPYSPSLARIRRTRCIQPEEIAELDAWLEKFCDEDWSSLDYVPISPQERRFINRSRRAPASSSTTLSGRVAEHISRAPEHALATSSTTLTGRVAEDISRAPGHAPATSSTTLTGRVAEDISTAAEPAADELATTSETVIDKDVTTPDIVAEKVTTTTVPVAEQLAATPEIVVERVVTTPEIVAEKVPTTTDTAAEKTATTPQTVAETVVTRPETVAEQVIITPETVAAEIAPTPTTVTAEVATTLDTVAEKVVVTPEIIAEDDVDVAKASKRSATGRKARKEQREATKVRQAAKAKVTREADARKAAQTAQEAARTAEEIIAAARARVIPTTAALPALTTEWETKVEAAMNSNPTKELAWTPQGAALSRADFGTVLPRSQLDRTSGWLNDEIVNAYLQLVTHHDNERTRRSREPPKHHAFNSFFYSNLRDKGPKSVSRWATKAGLGGKNLLRADHIFIPVHQGAHWTLAVVSPQARTLEYFDSLGGRGRDVFRNIQQWLSHELQDSWNEDEWKIEASGTPRQLNTMDCGVFVATTARMVRLGIEPAAAYSQADIPLQRRRMVAEFLNSGLLF
ncbi:MAG: Smt3-specific protease [Caeruleum heppii]|nr:MAG: Smt3-specific protease [Caeruleum heppii]